MKDIDDFLSGTIAWLTGLLLGGLVGSIIAVVLISVTGNQFGAFIAGAAIAIAIFHYFFIVRRRRGGGEKG